LRRFRLGQFLTPQRQDLNQWRGMEMFLDRQMEADDPRLQAIYQNFRNNLTRICRIALDSHAAVVLSTVAVNLKDNPPFAGTRAAEAFRAGDFAKARDFDTLRFRADSRINAIIREVAGSFPSMKLIDAEKFIPPDATAFYEHVHLRPGENAKLAAAIVGSDAPPLFNPTAWDQHRMLRDIVAMMSRPPFHSSTALLPELEELRKKVNLAEAENAYRAWSARFPNDLLIRERYAELLAEAGKYNDAVEQWRWLTAQLPEIPNWHTGLAESLLSLGKLNEAKQAYEQALRIDPEFIAAYIGLGAVAFTLGHQADAEARFRAALAIDPSSSEANNDLAGILVRQNKLADAATHFAEAVRVKPEFANAQYSYAATLARLGRTGEAIQHYHDALAANPDFPAAHYDLGLLLAEQRKFQEAIGHYQDALRLDPKNADAENNWGTALARQGRVKDAIPHFEAALRLQPNHAQALKNLASARRPR
jgi:tetratricopeptide (TPR) repeat protein